MGLRLSSVSADFCSIVEIKAPSSGIIWRHAKVLNSLEQAKVAGRTAGKANRLRQITITELNLTH